MNRRRFFAALLGLAAAPLLKFVPEQEGVLYTTSVDRQSRTITLDTKPPVAKLLRPGTTYHFYPGRDQRSGR
jgi:hypothetical protein